MSTIEVAGGLELEDLRRRWERTGEAAVLAFAQGQGAQAAALGEWVGRLARELPHVRFVLCDPQHCPALAEALGIERLPDVVVLAGDRVTERLHGITQLEELASVVEHGVRRSDRLYALVQAGRR
jgi:tRNA G37 N-methylase Trm5